MLNDEEFVLLVIIFEKSKSQSIYSTVIKCLKAHYFRFSSDNIVKNNR